MSHVLIASVATPGHVYPMLTIARHLVTQGHQVTLFSGVLFREQALAAGLGFVAFEPEIDFDYRFLERHFPERAILPPGHAQMALALRGFFSGPIPVLDRQLQQILAQNAIDVVMVGNCFYGILPLLARRSRPPVIGIGVTPLSFSTRDAIFYGPRIPPALLPPELTREQLIDAPTRELIDGVKAAFDKAMVASGQQPLDKPHTDTLIGGCDRFLQLSTTELEYPRDDLPPSVRFVGPLPLNVSDVETDNTMWPGQDTRPLVIVSQGTLANVDLQQLIGPTLRALAHFPVRVLATTGGRSVASLADSVPENARVCRFVSLEHWLPQAALLITNGGYGSLNAALSHGVPLIVAGTGEDKSETAARVVLAGCGLNLATSTPSESQIAQAVQRILAHPIYTRRARWIQEDCARHDALAAIAQEVAALG